MSPASVTFVALRYNDLSAFRDSSLSVPRPLYRVVDKQREVRSLLEFFEAHVRHFVALVQTTSSGLLLHTAQAVCDRRMQQIDFSQRLEAASVICLSLRYSVTSLGEASSFSPTVTAVESRFNRDLIRLVGR